MFLSTTLFAVALGAVAARAQYVSECTSGPVASYLPLSDDDSAKSFCSQNYPATTTITSCSVPSTAPSKRDQNDWPLTIPPPPQIPGPPVPTPTNGDQAKAALFGQLMSQNNSILATFCSCILPLPTMTASCGSDEYCDPSTSTCKVDRDCSNPFACDGHSYCGTGPSGQNLFCHQDTDDSTMGYCMNNGPSGDGCPQPYEDCEKNADCGGQRVCIYSCCRAEPFCVDIRDYQNGNSVANVTRRERERGIFGVR